MKRSLLIIAGAGVLLLALIATMAVWRSRVEASAQRLKAEAARQEAAALNAAHKKDVETYKIDTSPMTGAAGYESAGFGGKKPAATKDKPAAAPAGTNP